LHYLLEREHIFASINKWKMLGTETKLVFSYFSPFKLIILLRTVHLFALQNHQTILIHHQRLI